MWSFSLGRLIGAMHRSNSRQSRYAGPRSGLNSGYLFYYVRHGDLLLASDDGEAHLLPGDMALFRPCPMAEFRSLSGQIDMMAFFLPHKLVKRLSPDGEIAICHKFPQSSGLVACVSSLLETVMQRHKDLTIEEISFLQTVLSDAMVQLGVNHHTRPDFGLSSAQGEMLRALQAIAMCRLEDPELAPAAIAREAGISTRTLHRLFHASGVTFRSWLKDRRLERCRIEITDPTRGDRTIASVALRWGFNDLTTFNRNFRERYGVSPTMARSAPMQE